MATIVMSADVRAQLIDHCRQQLPEEACGLIAGRIERTGAVRPAPPGDPQPDDVPPADRIPEYDEPDDVVKVVERIYPVENVDHSPEHFTIDPRDQLRVLKQARAEGLQLLGNFHSHPATPARPSVEDKRLLNDPAATYLIASFASEPPALNAFRINGESAWREPVEEAGAEL